jgi:hypothetical protein
MTGLITAIAVAVIGGPIMWLLTRLDRRNSEQHAENGQVLERIETKLDRHDEKLDRLDSKLDNHVNNPKGHR